MLIAPDTQETLYPAAWYWTTGPCLDHRPNTANVGTTNYPYCDLLYMVKQREQGGCKDGCQCAQACISILYVEAGRSYSGQAQTTPDMNAVPSAHRSANTVLMLDPFRDPTNPLFGRPKNRLKCKAGVEHAPQLSQMSG
jgi:hypothetical protein